MGSSTSSSNGRRGTISEPLSSRIALLAMVVYETPIDALPFLSASLEQPLIVIVENDTSQEITQAGTDHQETTP